MPPRREYCTNTLRSECKISVPTSNLHQDSSAHCISPPQTIPQPHHEVKTLQTHLLCILSRRNRTSTQTENCLDWTVTSHQFQHFQSLEKSIFSAACGVERLNRQFSFPHQAGSEPCSHCFRRKSCSSGRPWNGKQCKKISRTGNHKTRAISAILSLGKDRLEWMNWGDTN